MNLDLCQMTEYQNISNEEDAETRRLKLLSITKYPQANCYAVKQVLETLFCILGQNGIHLILDNSPKQVYV